VVSFLRCGPHSSSVGTTHTEPAADRAYRVYMSHTGDFEKCTADIFDLTHCGRVTQICVFNAVKLGTSASSP